MKRLLTSVLGTSLSLLLGGTAARADNGQRGECHRTLDVPAVPGVQLPISVPADDSAHPYGPAGDEWWYYSGHLTADDGSSWGFDQIVYTVLANPADPTSAIQYADFTLSDVAGRKFHFAGRQYLFAPATARAGGFSFQFDNGLDTEAVEGGNGHDHLHSTLHNGAGTFELDVAVEAVKSPVVHSLDPSVQYYSRERMLTLGSLVINGKRHRVSGWTWFDHQFGPQLLALQYVKNWTWVAVQLHEGRELFFVVINRVDPATGASLPTVAKASLSDSDCETVQLDASEFSLVAQGSPFLSQPDSCPYPARWRIEVPKSARVPEALSLTVEPLFPDQEIRVPVNDLIPDRYWEGVASVAGSIGQRRVSGEASVELSNWCPPTP
jgi:predicted secreted hydrolase